MYRYMTKLDVPRVIQSNKDEASQGELYVKKYMDLCTVNCKESSKTLILRTCTSVDLNVIVIGRVRVINSPPLGPCELDSISNFHQNTSYQTLKVLLSLYYCMGQFIRFLEIFNSSFISTRGLRLFSFTVPLSVFKAIRTIILEEISTQNGPFNFKSNSMSSCVSQ